MKNIKQGLNEKDIKKYQNWCKTNGYKEDKISKLRFIAEVMGNEEAKTMIDRLDKGELKEDDIRCIEEQCLTKEEYVEAFDKVYVGLSMLVDKNLLNFSEHYKALDETEKAVVAKSFANSFGSEIAELLLKLNFGIMFTLGLSEAEESKKDSETVN